MADSAVLVSRNAQSGPDGGPCLTGCVRRRRPDVADGPDGREVKMGVPPGREGINDRDGGREPDGPGGKFGSTSELTLAMGGDMLGSPLLRRRGLCLSIFDCSFSRDSAFRLAST